MRVPVYISGALPLASCVLHHNVRDAREDTTLRLHIMALPEIGAHCTLQTCNVNDFLPIRCRCDDLFCKDHISPEAHSCPLLQTKGPVTDTDAAQRLQKCASDKCNKPSLEAFVADSSDTQGRTPALCSRCRLAFCATCVVCFLRCSFVIYNSTQTSYSGFPLVHGCRSRAATTAQRGCSSYTGQDLSRCTKAVY